jgi:hypothetical protein
MVAASYDRPVVAALLATAVVSAAPGPLIIEVPDSGRIVRVGAFKPRQFLGEHHFPGGVAPIRRTAIRAFGRPDRRDAQGCPNRWRRLRLRLVTADFGGGPACAPATPVQHVEIFSRRWRTERGLRVGDSLDRVRELYPELRRFSDLFGPAPAWRYDWALVLEPSRVGGPPNLIDRLSAVIRDRRVRYLRVSPYGAGD